MHSSQDLFRFTTEITQQAECRHHDQNVSGEDSIRAGESRMVTSLGDISTRSAWRHLDRSRVVVTLVAPISSPKRSWVRRKGNWNESLQRKPRRLTSNASKACSRCSAWPRWRTRSNWRVHSLTASIPSSSVLTASRRNFRAVRASMQAPSLQRRSVRNLSPDWRNARVIPSVSSHGQ